MKNIVNEKMKIDSMKHVTKKNELSDNGRSGIFLCSFIPTYRTDFI